MNTNTSITPADIQSRIDVLIPVFARAAVGDFSADIQMPESEDAFTPLLAGVQIMLEVIREKIAESNSINDKLLLRMEETTAILASIGDGVVVLDIDGKVVFLNLVGERMLGLKSSEIMGKRWVDLVPLQEENGELVPADERPFEAKYEIPSEAPVTEKTLYYVRTNGSRFPVGTTVSPVILHGNRTGIILVFRDESRQKELEHLKDEFLSIAAHELRTPLGTMRWTMDLLLKEEVSPLSATLRAKIEKLYENNLLMISLVNDILSISRLTGEDTINEDKKVINLSAAISAAIEEVTPQTVAGKVHIVFEKTDPQVSSLSFLVDETHFRQVMVNLLSNAIKYNHENGSVTITLKHDANEVCIDISDTGIGISDVDKDHVFERFYRGERVAQSSISGTGLGLYVVKSYVKKWGATITFESEEGKGTTFHLCLPQTITTVST